MAHELRGVGKDRPADTMVGAPMAVEQVLYRLVGDRVDGLFDQAGGPWVLLTDRVRQDDAIVGDDEQGDVVIVAQAVHVGGEAGQLRDRLRWHLAPLERHFLRRHYTIAPDRPT